MHRRAEMKMPRHERWLNLRSSKFPPHDTCARAFPDGVLNAHDRRHQRDQTKISLDHCKESPDPSAITGCWKFGVDRTMPSDCRSVTDLTRGSAIARKSIKIACREFLAFCHVAFHFIPAACVQPMT